MSWKTLRKRRPKSLLVRWSIGSLLVAMAASWFMGNLQMGKMFSTRSLENAQRFSQRLIPAPVRQSDGDWSTWYPWAKNFMFDHGFTAMIATLAISVAAIVLAFYIANILGPFASRNLITPHPFLKGTHPAHPVIRTGWTAIVWITRGFFVFTRAIPEYIFAFLLVGMLGANAWPAVLALALHNAGILGRLSAETIENIPSEIHRALRTIGSNRIQIVLFGIIPVVLPRVLVYFFYRWETCVREATIIGMLGIASLGFYIVDARARMRYDDLLGYIILGAILVLAGDVLSAHVRKWIRHHAA